MLDPKLLRENPDKVRKALSDRGANVSLLDKFNADRRKMAESHHEIEELKAKKNAESQEIPKLKAAKKDATKLLAEMKKLSERYRIEREEALEDIEKELNDSSYFIPNIPHRKRSHGEGFFTVM